MNKDKISRAFNHIYQAAIAFYKGKNYFGSFAGYKDSPDYLCKIKFLDNVFLDNFYQLLITENFCSKLLCLIYQYLQSLKDAVNKNNGFSVVARAGSIKNVLIRGDITNFDIIEKIP